MAVRTDLVVNYLVDPRIVTILSPSVEITVQDLHDTLRDIEDEPANMDQVELLSSAGKESLGGGVSVGLTSTMLNTQVAFEGRTTVTSTGTTTGGLSTLTLIDSTATFQTDLVTRGSVVHNQTDGSSCEVTSVDSEIQLTCTALTGGAGNDWGTGDAYDVFLVIQCNIGGGNLVAVDSLNVELDPVFPTSYVQVVRTASSSATLVEQSAIQFASFNGGVTVDLSTAFSGTTFPVGTAQEPVNNFSDALAIALERGFDNLFVRGSATLTGLDFSNKIIHGQSPTFSTLTIDPTATTTTTGWRNALLTGTLDAGADITDCTLTTLTMDGAEVNGCELNGTITLAGTALCEFVNCWSGVPGEVTPSLDVGGAGGPDFLMRAFNGGIEFKNMVDSVASVDMSSGQVIVNANCTGGTLTIRGLGKITDNSTGTTVNSASYLEPHQLTETFEAIATRKEFDFTGNDVLGWQEVLYDEFGVETGRFNLFDESFTRINETSASFVSRGGMIARRVKV